MVDRVSLTRVETAQTVADFASRLTLSDLPTSALRAVEHNIEDTLTCALAGSSALAVDDIAGLVREWAGSPQATVFVSGERYPAHHVAWVNGTMAHARDYDDTHDSAILHAGVSVVPAALAAAELNPAATGADVLAGVAAGLETLCRLGVAIEVDIVESGYIYSSLLGYFGATAAAGRILGLDPDQMLNALGIVYSSAAGNHQVTRDASLMKRVQPSLAAQAAVVAVQLAARGVRGAQRVFDGEDGLFRVYLHDRVDRAKVTEGLGTTWELENLSYKPYPCCRDTHSAIDAALELRAAATRPVEEITGIRVGVTAPGYQMVCTPEEVRRTPRTIVEAQFSIPFTVAAALIDGALTLDLFTTDGIERPDILELAARVHPYVDDEIDREWRRYVTPARVEITYADGTVVASRVDYATGHPRRPMSEQQIALKAADCVAYAAQPMPEGAADRLLSAVRGLADAPDVTAVVAAMVAGLTAQN
ncbi:MmgE/PrpD family protein [Microbacterium sp. X-17]|uniref:MmgE/PrpD family protein n=1 Tax=Microbacterium sp. X-17 TaxID=3144404 RepID=UPI0031F5088F